MKIWIIGILALFLSGCNEEFSLLPAENQSMHSTSLMMKTGTAARISKVETPQLLETNMYSFVTILSWFDDFSLLYLTDENGVSFLHKFHLTTGETNTFFKINKSVIQVIPNTDYSIFAIELASIRNHNEFYFVDKEGNLLYIFENGGQDVQFFWNHYNPNIVTIASLQDDFSIQLFMLDLEKRKINLFPFDHYYVQWISNNEIAFLKWDPYSLGYYAPLYTYELDEKQELFLLDDVIGFFSFKDYFMAISIEGTHATNSLYQFFSSTSKKQLSELKVPILNTYSQQWWIPSHDYNELTKQFFYLKPTNAGDLFDYTGEFVLSSFHIETGLEKEIAQLATNYPIEVSPNGQWILYGYQLEKVIDVKKNEIYSLLHW